MASIFSKILKGDIPGFFIDQDEWTFSILTLDAIQLGHTLVIPKLEADYFVDVPEPYYSKVYEHAKRVAPAIHKATGCRRVGQSVIGLEVPHFHLHLIPMFDAGDMNFARAKRYSSDEMKKMQQKILDELKNSPI